MEKIGRYEIIRELGKGGMGRVLLARDPRLSREVAIKCLRAEDADPDKRDMLLKRLVREAEAGAKLKHPNIVAVFDIIESPDSVAIVMEFVRGGNLAETPDLAPDYVLRVLRECADALDHAHSRGVIHRDIKPANIMLEESGIVKIADFGIARIAGANTDLTGKYAIGTLEYMSPEQLSASKELDGRSDQYSLAVVAYGLLTRQKPFDAITARSLSAQILAVPAVPASARNPALPKQVDHVLGRALSKRPEERYASCRDFVDALTEAFRATPVLPPTEPMPMARSRSRWYWLSAPVLVLAAAGGWLASRDRTPEKSKTPEAGSRSAPAKPAEPQAGQIWRNPKDGLEYVRIPSGSFEVGCRGACDSDDILPHSVTVANPFWMGQTEVTAGAYKKYAAAAARPMPPAPSFDANWHLDDHPMVQVTWDEAKAFCEWAGGRLPSEEQWEYAARAGRGDVTAGPQEAHFDAEATAAVKSLAPNAFGLYDISGNAAEWVDGPGPQHVVRGGGWNVSAASLRLSKRVVVDGDRRSFAFGMRCVLP